MPRFSFKGFFRRKKSTGSSPARTPKQTEEPQPLPEGTEVLLLNSRARAQDEQRKEPKETEQPTEPRELDPQTVAEEVPEQAPPEQAPKPKQNERLRKPRRAGRQPSRRTRTGNPSNSRKKLQWERSLAHHQKRVKRSTSLGQKNGGAEDNTKGIKRRATSLGMAATKKRKTIPPRSRRLASDIGVTGMKVLQHDGSESSAEEADIEADDEASGVGEAPKRPSDKPLAPPDHDIQDRVATPRGSWGYVMRVDPVRLVTEVKIGANLCEFPSHKLKRLPSRAELYAAVKPRKRVTKSKGTHSRTSSLGRRFPGGFTVKKTNSARGRAATVPDPEDMPGDTPKALARKDAKRKVSSFDLNSKKPRGSGAPGTRKTPSSTPPSSPRKTDSTFPPKANSLPQRSGLPSSSSLRGPAGKLRTTGQRFVSPSIENSVHSRSRKEIRRESATMPSSTRLAGIQRKRSATAHSARLTRVPTAASVSSQAKNNRPRRISHPERRAMRRQYYKAVSKMVANMPPGKYRLLSNAAVRKTEYRTSEWVAAIAQGSIVDIDTVTMVGDRLRGSIPSPLGWISMATRDYTKVWVEVVSGSEAGGLTSQPTLLDSDLFPRKAHIIKIDNARSTHSKTRSSSSPSRVRSSPFDRPNPLELNLVSLNLKSSRVALKEANGKDSLPDRQDSLPSTPKTPIQLKDTPLQFPNENSLAGKGGAMRSRTRQGGRKGRTNTLETDETLSTLPTLPVGEGGHRRVDSKATSGSRRTALTAMTANTVSALGEYGDNLKTQKSEHSSVSKDGSKLLSKYAPRGGAKVLKPRILDSEHPDPDPVLAVPAPQPITHPPRRVKSKGVKRISLSTVSSRPSFSVESSADASPLESSTVITASRTPHTLTMSNPIAFMIDPDDQAERPNERPDDVKRNWTRVRKEEPEPGSDRGYVTPTGYDGTPLSSIPTAIIETPTLKLAEKRSSTVPIPLTPRKDPKKFKPLTPRSQAKFKMLPMPKQVDVPGNELEPVPEPEPDQGKELHTKEWNRPVRILDAEIYGHPPTMRQGEGSVSDNSLRRLDGKPHHERVQSAASLESVDTDMARPNIAGSQVQLPDLPPQGSHSGTSKSCSPSPFTPQQVAPASAKIRPLSPAEAAAEAADAVMEMPTKGRDNEARDMDRLSPVADVRRLHTSDVTSLEIRSPLLTPLSHPSTINVSTHVRASPTLIKLESTEPVQIPTEQTPPTSIPNTPVVTARPVPPNTTTPKSNMAIITPSPKRLTPKPSPNKLKDNSRHKGKRRRALGSPRKRGNMPTNREQSADELSLDSSATRGPVFSPTVGDSRPSDAILPELKIDSDAGDAMAYGDFMTALRSGIEAKKLKDKRKAEEERWKVFELNILNREAEIAEYRKRIEDILSTHSPEKLTNLPSLLRRHYGKEHEIYLRVCKKYKIQPLPEFELTVQSNGGEVTSKELWSSQHELSMAKRELQSRQGLAPQLGRRLTLEKNRAYSSPNLRRRTRRKAPSRKSEKKDPTGRLYRSGSGPATRLRQHRLQQKKKQQQPVTHDDDKCSNGVNSMDTCRTSDSDNVYIAPGERELTFPDLPQERRKSGGPRRRKGKGVNKSRHRPIVELNGAGIFQVNGSYKADAYHHDNVPVYVHSDNSAKYYIMRLPVDDDRYWVIRSGDFRKAAQGTDLYFAMSTSTTPPLLSWLCFKAGKPPAPQCRVKKKGRK